MAKTQMPATKSGGDIVKVGHTKTNAFGGNPDAKRHGPGQSATELSLKG